MSETYIYFFLILLSIIQIILKQAFSIISFTKATIKQKNSIKLLSEWEKWQIEHANIDGFVNH